MRHIVEFVKEALVAFFYPGFCLHCHDSIKAPSFIFCDSCSSLMEMIDPAQRCPRCFSDDSFNQAQACLQCRKESSPLFSKAAVFDYIGPPSTLIRQLKYAGKPFLAKGAAAFMVAQWARLGWPLPDLIVPVPISFTHWLERGFNQSELIAKEMATMLERPVVNLLHRRSGDYSQAGMTFEQRRTLNSQSFSLKKNLAIQDQVVLLVDDVTTTGTTIQRCAECLMGAYPRLIYGLSFCQV